MSTLTFLRLAYDLSNTLILNASPDAVQTWSIFVIYVCGVNWSLSSLFLLRFEII